MTDLVDDLKQNKEEIEYKLVQFEDIIKCQKLDIESKANLIKKFELVIVFVHLKIEIFILNSIFSMQQIQRMR
jgi:hypothetical protein